MSGTLALVGGAEFGPECSFDAGLFPPGSEVVLLPTAQAYERPAAALAAATAHLEPLGITVRALPVYTRGDASDERLADEVRSAGSLYVVGGSPMHLRAVLKGTVLLDALVDSWRRGATVAVAAEAAAVMCSHMVDSRGGAFTVGLGLVTSMTVIPRFNQWSPDKLHRTIRLAPPDLLVVGIDESTALTRGGDGTWTVQGTGGVHVFEGARTVGVERLPHALNPDAGL